jgi:ADP-ribosyl-[dinitrogen reductase] hydrolase
MIGQSQEERNKYIGMLVGLAVGDAVGTTNEFEKDPAPITDMVGGGPFCLKAGQWTDDTSMALCLADSLIDMGRFNYADQLDKYVEWWQYGYNSVTGRCFDIGGTTQASLHLYVVNGSTLSSLTESRNSGNGSLMRLAPVVIFYSLNENAAVYWAGESSRTTHNTKEAVAACQYFTKLLLNAVRGYSKELLMHTMPDFNAPAKIIEISEFDYLSMTRDDVKNPSGYVVDSLKAALWCFFNTNTFTDGCLLAANLGGDADTVGAIYGQLAGAYYGVENIPQSWLDKLAWKEKIVETAKNLYDMRIMDQR